MNIIQREINELAQVCGENPTKEVYKMIGKEMTYMLEGLLEEVNGKRHPSAVGGIKGMLERSLEEI